MEPRQGLGAPFLKATLSAIPPNARGLWGGLDARFRG